MTVRYPAGSASLTKEVNITVSDGEAAHAFTHRRDLAGDLTVITGGGVRLGTVDGAFDLAVHAAGETQQYLTVADLLTNGIDGIGNRLGITRAV